MIKYDDLIKNRAHETAFVTDDAAVAFFKFECRNTFVIISHAIAVILIGPKARKAEKGIGNVACPFMRQEIAVMRPAHPVDYGYPATGIILELGDFMHVDNIFQIAGDHGGSFRKFRNA